MIADGTMIRRAASFVLAVGALIAAGCVRRHSEPPPVIVATTIQEIPSIPGASQGTAPTLGAIPQSGASPAVMDAAEPYIDFYGVDSDVRLVLQRIAEIAKIDLIIPANIHKRISVQYVHVPVSVALRDVLARSGLRLGSASTKLPFDTVTVFYQLPANVDSMSAEGIMKRYGVSREIAELIVRSRRP
ncbi:MAG TPA: hypothetical protein VIV65_11890 [Gemmatimonadaceae bacterium]